MVFSSKDVSDKFERLKSLTTSVNDMIECGNFYKLPYMKRHSYVHKIKQLYNRLLGPLTAYELTTAIAGLSLLVFGATACAKKDNNPAAPMPTPADTWGTTSFASPQTNSFRLSDPGRFTGPAFADLDGDGDYDMITYSYYDSYYLGPYSTAEYVRLTYFKNIGTSAAPAFTNQGTNPFNFTPPNASEYSRIALVDIDSDGDVDLFSLDSYSDFYYYKNTGSSTVANFSNYQQNPFNLQNISGWLPSLTFVDLDKDGDQDIMCGHGYDGSFVYFENTGSASSPSFTKSSNNPFNLTSVPYCATSAFMDFDNDGDEDMLAGCNGSFYDRKFQYFENIGTASSPVFGTRTNNVFGLTTAIGNYQSPAFVDIDNDGDLDLFSGSSGGEFYYFENTRK